MTNNIQREAESLAVLELRRDIARDECDALETKRDRLNGLVNDLSAQLGDAHRRGVVDEHLEARWQTARDELQVTVAKRDEVAGELSRTARQIMDLEQAQRQRRRGPELEL